MDHSHMDHSGMDHGGMDHGGMDHGGMDHGGSGPMCNMNMLFTWDPTNLCIVFRGWHVRGFFSLIFSLLAIVVICAGYEALRDGIRRYEVFLDSQQDSVPNPVPEEEVESGRYGGTETDQDGLLGGENGAGEQQNTESTPFLRGTGRSEVLAQVTQRARIVKAVLYGIQNFYAFMIMLIFMTYNGWVMIAVAVGAGVGYYLFGAQTKMTKDTACH